MFAFFPLLTWPSFNCSSKPMAEATLWASLEYLMVTLSPFLHYWKLAFDSDRR